ncbi:MAG: DinB family protein [Bacteroidota bacterium]
MKKQEIMRLLAEHHQAFTKNLDTLSDEDFERTPGTKWTAGQQLDHILKSVIPVAKAFNSPLEVLESKFGLSEKPSRSYTQLVEDYLMVLQKLKDFVLPERFVPHPLSAENKSTKFEELVQTIFLLNQGLRHFEEETLDTHSIFHPAMGKLSLREILYFTIYHVTHHEKQIQKNLNDHPV